MVSIDISYPHIPPFYKASFGLPGRCQHLLHTIEQANVLRYVALARFTTLLAAGLSGITQSWESPLTKITDFFHAALSSCCPGVGVDMIMIQT